ncbi:uncharacterized protein LOC123565318 [Mercenaria mercenaria]|uniref:uncharacterized protein LOC123565318 n=1 Tax=Mercenaria mercenaria TaxID=6596 RepID=UPI00234F8982|nr:uncharacterized protein LOC123565318 [Mercenaria mercenaria]
MMGKVLLAVAVLAVYVATSYAYDYIGCYEDKKSRILEGKFTSGDMTVEKCIQTCSIAKYRYAGVEYQNQCFCGNKIKPYKRLAESACSTSCGGNSNQKCGGTWKISIYHTNKYLGCYVDKSSRILSGPKTDSSTKMTAKFCLQFCKGKNQAFALTQYSNQCFCGNNFKDYDKKSDSECSYKCTGAKSEFCGGFWRGSLYVV